jgi:amidohydrolase
MKLSFASIVVSLLLAVHAAPCAGQPDLERRIAEVEPQVIAWRREFHANPELGNREVRTGARIAEELTAMGLEVTTGIAHTGVVGYLRGRSERPLVAVRADMDALPVTEEVDLPFASKVRATYNGQEVGVMHACGHDTHMAMTLGLARVLSAAREELPGSVLFIFQPAEEGPPEGEEGGAKLMLAEGIFEGRKPDAVFGLHVFSSLPSGVVAYRSGPIMAAYDLLEITVSGRQTHGARPWSGVDPIVVASQIVLATQTIVSRQVDITKAPAVISYGAIDGGLRHNIIPDRVELIGTIRTFDPTMRERIHQSLERTATNTAEAAGASADVRIVEGYPVVVNDPALTARMVPALEELLGPERVVEGELMTAAEDFAYFAQVTPGLILHLGVTPAGQSPETAPANHSPLFFVDESALITGVRVLERLVEEYLQNPL